MKINTDSFLVSRETAAALCIHHLRLAHLFYQNIPEGTEEEEQNLLINELCEQLQEGGEVPPTLEYPAYIDFIETVTRAYAHAREQD